MGMFNSILAKLGIGDDTPDAPPAGTPAAPAEQAAPAAPAEVQAISEVDVVARLESLAASNSQTLNWKMSIVDLLKLLGLDSSIGSRRELATELGYPGDINSDSARMNIWLHKTVLRKLAENGGNIPADLLD